jgi:hypothetical protein
VAGRNERIDFLFHFIAQLIGEGEAIDDSRFDRFFETHPDALLPDLSVPVFLLPAVLSEAVFSVDFSVDLSLLLESLFDDGEDDSPDPESSADFFPPLLP